MMTISDPTTPNIRKSLIKQYPDLWELLQKLSFKKKRERQRIRKLMGNAINHGLKNEGDSYLYHPLKMINTHLSVIPNGSEQGPYIALDLGGTNLRILTISMEENKLVPKHVVYSVPICVQTGTSDNLFDFLAEKIEKGLKELGFLNWTNRVLGFTFSFPVKQIALNQALLIKWCKGYAVAGVEGQDVVQLLKNACQRRSMNIKDIVLINDTTGTLLCGAYEDQSSVIGVINGTGTNACYLEQISNIPNWTGSTNFASVILNTEWGAFGDHGELEQYRTEYDAIVDMNSINPGSHKFEKMVSGMFIGRITHSIINKAVTSIELLSGKVPDFIKDSIDGFPTQLVFLVYKKAEFINKLKEQYNYQLEEKDYLRLYLICTIVIKRSAQLLAAGLAALIDRIPKSHRHYTIAADGSIFSQNPFYLKYVEKYLRTMLKKDQSFTIKLVSDGSGKGAALAAAVVEENK